MSNTIHPDAVKRWVGEIQKHQEQLLSLRGSYMNDCRAVREDIKSCMKAAKNEGIPRKELSALLKKLDLQAKIAALIEDMEPEEVDTFEAIEAALGDYQDTPLGQAAVDKVNKRQKAKNAAVNAIVD